MKILQKVELSTVLDEKRHHHCLKTIGEELKILSYLEEGLSYREVAKKTGMSKSYICKLVKIYKELLKQI